MNNNNIKATVVMLIISHFIVMGVSFMVGGISESLKAKRYWDAKPRPIQYVDTCASYNIKHLKHE